MGGKSIPCLEGSLTDDTEVGHVKVDLSVPLGCLFSQKGLVAAEAEEPPIMSSRYHLIHKRIQVRCEHSVRFLIQFVRLRQPCYGIEAILLICSCLLKNCYITKSFHGPRRMHLVPMNSGIVNGKSIPGTTHLGAQVAGQLHAQVSFRVPSNLVHIVKTFPTVSA